MIYQNYILTRAIFLIINQKVTHSEVDVFFDDELSVGSVGVDPDRQDLWGGIDQTACDRNLRSVKVSREGGAGDARRIDVGEIIHRYVVQERGGHLIVDTRQLPCSRRIRVDLTSHAFILEGQTGQEVEVYIGSESEGDDGAPVSVLSLAIVLDLSDAGDFSGGLAIGQEKQNADWGVVLVDFHGSRLFQEIESLEKGTVDVSRWNEKQTIIKNVYFFSTYTM